MKYLEPHPPRPMRLAACALLSAGLLACSADTGSAGRRAQAAADPFQNASTPAASAAAEEGPCTAGSNRCFCPDGSQSGSQFCDARGELGPCSCASSGDAVLTGASPTLGDPGRVCSELEGMPGCDAVSYVSPQVPSSILFVVDRSGSMACNPPPVQSVEDCSADPRRADAASPSRWEITVDALDEAFAGLSGSNASVGINMFSTDGVCGADSVPFVGLDAVNPVQLMALSDALRSAKPAGGTPIVGSTILAYNHLHQELEAAGNRYVVLITDGEESCGTLGGDEDPADLAAARDRLLQQEVRKARDANIRTFVIGAPGSERARGFLSELAFLGGTARREDCAHADPDGDVGDCHFDLTVEADFAAVLRESLGEISGQALGCEFRTPSGSSTRINVQSSLGGAQPSCMAFDDAPCDGGANGWQFAKLPDGSDDLGRVVLCGQACEQVKADPTTVVDVILGCQVLE